MAAVNAGVALRGSAMIRSGCGLLPLILTAQPALDGYANYESFRAELQKLDASDRVSVASLARTAGGRDVWLVTVAEGKPEDKPAVLIVGSVHGPHLVGSELATRLARLLSEKEELLRRATFYLIPRPNPDASEAAFRRPSGEREVNERDVDDDRDGRSGEDPPDDLNGDGWITTMRVEDETGGWMPHPKDPRVLIEADAKKNEAARYALYIEGRDDDRDEKFNEDGPGGVSFNRNFTFRYGAFGAGSGPHSVSEPETRAVADFCFDRPNIAAVLTFAPEENLLRPWKAESSREKPKIPTSVAAGDGPIYEHAAEAYRQILGLRRGPEPPRTEGSFVEWAYYHYGRWSFATRGWRVPSPEPEKKEGERDQEGDEEGTRKKPDRRGEEMLHALRWFEQEKIDGFIPWKACDHPDFPGRKVEIGGFKPFVLLNPPARELDPLAAKHLEFVARLVEFLPKIRVSELKAEPLGGGVHRVTATVVNSGYFPTVSEMGAFSKELHPLQARVEGAKVIAGVARARLEPLAGLGGKAEPSWLIQGEPGAEVKVAVWSPSVGSDARTVRLEEKK
jgi:hypothetical protein